MSEETENEKEDKEDAEEAPVQTKDFSPLEMDMSLAPTGLQ